MSIEPDVAELRSFFANAGAHHVVALIDYLATPEGRKNVGPIGSGNIDISGLPNENGRFFLGSRSLYIGNSKETPLQALHQLMTRFDELAPEEIFLFDELCGELLAWTITPGTPLEEMTEEQRQKFR